MTAALKHAARQQMMKHRSELRQAAVGEWEMVIRAADSSCIWRVEVNQEQGETFLQMKCSPADSKHCPGKNNLCWEVLLNFPDPQHIVRRPVEHPDLLHSKTVDGLQAVAHHG